MPKILPSDQRRIRAALGLAFPLHKIHAGTLDNNRFVRIEHRRCTKMRLKHPRDPTRAGAVIVIKSPNLIGIIKQQCTSAWDGYCGRVFFRWKDSVLLRFWCAAPRREYAANEEAHQRVLLDTMRRHQKVKKACSLDFKLEGIKNLRQQRKFDPGWCCYTF